MADQAIACMGELGACAAGAGAYAFPFAHVMPQPSYQQALEALIEGAADRALIPAYNTRTGAMPEALRLLAKSDFEIVGEVWREIELHVLVPRAWVKAHHPDYDTMSAGEKSRARAGLLGLIGEIYADQAAFTQYSAFLKRVVPRAQHHVTGCTGEAARLVHQNFRAADKPERYPSNAALASHEAAAMYGLVSLTGTLEADGDDGAARAQPNPAVKDNWTLFYIVEHRPQARDGRADSRWALFMSLYGEARLRKRLSDADLQKLFDGNAQLNGLLPGIGAGEPADNHAAERDYDLGKALFDAIKDRRGRVGKLVDRARAARMNPEEVDRVEAAESDIENAIKQCARWKPAGSRPGASLRAAKDVKTVLVLRADKSDPNGQRLLAALFGGKPNVGLRLMTPLPAPTDGSAGAGFIVESDGYLAGLDSGFGFFGGGSSPAERVMARLRGKADVHVLGSLPRAAYPLAPPKQAAAKLFGGHARWLRAMGMVGFALVIGALLYFLAK